MASEILRDAPPTKPVEGAHVDGPSFVTPRAAIDIDESQYKIQLESKVAKLRQLFQEFDPPLLEVFESPPSHYRMRAEFTVDQRGPELRYVMFDSSPAPPEEQQHPPAVASSDESALNLSHEPSRKRPAADAGADAGVEGEGEAPPEASTSAPSAPAASRGGPARQHKGPRRVTVERFPVASQQVNELMEVVRRECSSCPDLRHKLFQANFHTTLAGDAMVTLLYHRKLGPEWQAAAERLRDALAATPTAAAAGRRPHVIGRSRKQKINLESDFVLERLNVGGRTYVQKQVEGAFSQPNGSVCQHMLNWALDVTRRPAGGVGERAEGAAGDDTAAVAAEGAADGPHDDLLELYCGNGNFTIPLAQNFRRVVATEVAKSSVDAARFNLQANGVTNVFLARMASEEFAETMRERGTRRRLEGLGPWEELRLRTILVDPPRAGLDDFTVQLLKEFDRIVYISCNPETLHANLRAIGATHRIRRFAAFDQFPYTHHLECGVYLTRR